MLLNACFIAGVVLMDWCGACTLLYYRGEGDDKC